MPFVRFAHLSPRGFFSFLGCYWYCVRSCSHSWSLCAAGLILAADSCRQLSCDSVGFSAYMVPSPASRDGFASSSPVWTPRVDAPVRLAVGGVGRRGPRSSGASAWAAAGSGLVGRRGRCSASSVSGLSARRGTGLVLNAGSPSFRARPPGRGASSSFQDIAFDSLKFRL